MKNRIVVIVALLISIATFAQQGINYKAIIKDDLGNVVANQEVTIRFRILDALSGGNIVYQDTHNNVMTDANGIAIINISEGLQSLSYSFFDDIDWGSQAHFLQVGIDITGGTNFVDMGTTQFMAVPYAKHAESAANVSGIEYLDETDDDIDNGGWRLMGTNPFDHGNIGQWAVDVSRQQSESNIHGATGFASFAAGLNTEASGAYSVAMGDRTVASRFGSIALGELNVDNPFAIFSIGNGSTGGGRSNALTLTVYNDFIIGNSQIDDDPTDINDNTKFFFAGSKGSIRAGRVSVQSGDEWNKDNIGLYSAAFGLGTTASGNYSSAIGNRTIASTTSSFALGTSNIDDPDAILMVGNGTAPVSNPPSRNNAFVVKKDGDIVVDGEIQQTNTGNANMVPIAYGIIESNANVLSGTGNFTASISANIISISVNNESMNRFNTSCVITPYSTASRTSSIVMSGGDIQVRVFNNSGNLDPTTFQFVIYKL